MTDDALTLKDIYKQLPQHDKDLLRYAFERRLTQLVIYAPHKFIGVNVVESDKIIISAQGNSWSIGEIKDA